MDFKTSHLNNITFSELTSTDIQICGIGDILNVIANAPAKIILIHTERFCGDFFDAESGLAVKIINKADSYAVTLGIVGIVSDEVRSALVNQFRDHEVEKRVIFAATVEEARTLLAG